MAQAVRDQLSQGNHCVAVFVQILELRRKNRRGDGHVVGNDWTEAVIDENWDLRVVISLDPGR